MSFCQGLLHDIHVAGDDPARTAELAGLVEAEANRPERRDAIAACVETLRNSGCFDLLPTSVQRALHARPFFQIHHLRGGVSTHTSVRMDDLAAQRVADALRELPWNVWWQHSRVSDRVAGRGPTGIVGFGFKPVAFLPVKVHIELDPPFETTEESSEITRRKIVIESRFRGHFVGPARFEILDLPDGCTLRADWLRVQPGGMTRLLTRHRMAANHMACERGEMPFAKGSGYLGLMRYLRAQNRQRL